MTTERNAKEDDDLERPFTLREKIKLTVFFSLFYPVLLAVMLLPGAYMRSFPRKPSLWYGFWVTELSIPTMLLVALPFLFEHPRLIRKRMSKITAGKAESIAEQRFHKYTNSVFIFGLLVTSFDASGEETKAHYPKVWNWIGVTAMSVALALIVWVFRTNKYAARVVHVQPGQKLVTTGPYAIVRHPMYMAIIPNFLGFPLSIGSFWGVIPMVVCIVLVALRTYDEEHFLVETFGKDYKAYQKKVPYRMIPAIF